MEKFTCDVDGILNDYPLCWLRYLESKCGHFYNSVKTAKAHEKDYKQYKDMYRNSSYKANLPVKTVNRDTINAIINKGNEAIMVTSRPIFDNKYPSLYDNTYKWLINSRLSFSHLEYKDPYGYFLKKYSNINFHIDDDPIYAKIVANSGVRCFLLKNDNWDFSEINKMKNIVIVDNLNEILDYV